MADELTDLGLPVGLDSDASAAEARRKLLLTGNGIRPPLPPNPAPPVVLGAAAAEPTAPPRLGGDVSTPMIAPQRPLGPATQRLQSTLDQGAPNAPTGLKGFAYKLGGLFPLGRAIESEIPSTPLGYQTRLAGLEKQADLEQGLQKSQLGLQTQQANLGDIESQRREREAKAALELNKANTPAPVKMQRAVIEGPDGNPRAVDFNPQNGAYIDPDTGQAIAGARPFVKDATSKPSEEDKAVTDWMAANNLTDTPANRNKARVALKVQERPPQAGDWTLQEDANGKSVKFNQRTGEVQPVTGVQKAGTKAKQDAATAKSNEPFQAVLDKQKEAQEFAAQKTGPGDIGLILAMVEATRPKAGFRMTQTEWNNITHARSTLGDLQALQNRIESGQMLTDNQRQQMLNVIDVAAKAAQKHLSGGSSSSAVRFTEGSDQYDIPADKVDAFTKAHPNARRQ